MVLTKELSTLLTRSTCGKDSLQRPAGNGEAAADLEDVKLAQTAKGICTVSTQCVGLPEGHWLKTRGPKCADGPLRGRVCVGPGLLDYLTVTEGEALDQSTSLEVRQCQLRAAAAAGLRARYGRITSHIQVTQAARELRWNHRTGARTG